MTSNIRKMASKLSEISNERVLTEGWRTLEVNNKFTLEENYLSKNNYEYHIRRYSSTSYNDLVGEVFVSRDREEAIKIFKIVVKLFS